MTESFAPVPASRHIAVTASIPRLTPTFAQKLVARIREWFQ